MSQAKVSSKYQVVIPREIRERVNIKPGQNMIFVAGDGVISMVPDRDISELQGILKGMSSDNIREEEDRL